MANLILWSRRLAKTVVAGALGPLLPGRALVVLGYHRVVERFDQECRTMMPSMLVSRAMLERHLECLGRHYRFVSLDDIDAAVGAARRGKPAAAVTFDDGYRDVYELAVPLLRRKGIPAAVFVVTSAVGSDQPLLHDRLYRLAVELLPRWRIARGELTRVLSAAGIAPAHAPAILDAAVTPVALTRAFVTELTYDDQLRLVDALLAESGAEPGLPPGALPVTWEMVREMRRAGMTIGSHTARHIRLTNETRAVQTREIAESRARLEGELGEPIVQFAYPDGDFNSASVRIVERAGYRWAYTACRHRDPHHSRLTVPRLMLWEHSSIDVSGRLSPSILRCQSKGALDGSRSCRAVAHA
jgi:peptidoglycan/xylan/chitin deacetylase (PgdA/CDA1 family)